MNTDTTLSIAVIVTVGGFITSIINLLTGRSKSIKQETKEESGALEDIRTAFIRQDVKLDNIGTDISDIKADIKSTQRQVTDQVVAIAEIRRDLKTAFSRIEKLEGEQCEH